ncbi:hypothetical protein [Mesorhizobium carmichaelinearum]|uniref:hypothetical protein n=1 Tax=Mesorhizobium carmichaelinearum TaxID=1208188 RepID=UPI000BA48B11|nr:hypothetical protein [Mesorhizobium carmichaelinearum]
MSGTPLFSSARATLLRWTRLVPGLFRHDPLFRYASIAAVLALIFYAVSIGQQVAGPDAASSAREKTAPVARDSQGSAQQGSAGTAGNTATAGPPAPGSPGAPSATTDTAPISPGRTLDHLKVEPAARDSFGTMP